MSLTKKDEANTPRPLWCSYTLLGHLGREKISISQWGDSWSCSREIFKLSKRANFRSYLADIPLSRASKVNDAWLKECVVRWEKSICKSNNTLWICLWRWQGRVGRLIEIYGEPRSLKNKSNLRSTTIADHSNSLSLERYVVPPSRRMKHIALKIC